MNPWDGIFIYKDGQLYNHPNRKGHWIKHGVPIGGDRRGYLIVNYQGKQYPAHHVIWEIHNGPLPDNSMVEHINKIRDDNRIENLLLSPRHQSQIRTASRHKTTDLPKGIYFSKNGNYKARIMINGERITVGTFANIKLAEQAIKEAREKYHGEFANHE